MVGPRAPLGKLTDHIKGMLGNRPTEGTASKPSLSDLRNGGKGDMFDDSDVESSSSSSDSSDSDSDDGNNKSSFLRKIGATTSATASPAKNKTNGAVNTPTPAPKVPAKTNGATVKKEAAKSESSSASTSTSTSEDDSDSSESEEEEKDAAKKSVQNGKKAMKAASPSDTSSEESSSESEEEEEEEKVAPKSKPAQPKPASKPVAAAAAAASTSSSEASASSREASVESSASKETDDEEEVPTANGADSDEEMADQSFAITTRENGDSQVTDSTTQFTSQGFQLRRADASNDASDVTRIFRQAKLEGKQLWYFTVPASVPITVVEKMAIPVAKAEQGKAILSHDGQDYGMSFDDATTSKTIKLLIPNKAGDKYSMMDRTIDKTMHLQRVTRFAQEDEHAALPINPAVQARMSAKKPPRQQPEGLRARFLPIGVNDTVTSSKKRKHSVDAPATKASTSKAAADSDDDDSDGGAAVKKSSKKKATDVAVEPSPKKAKKDKNSASVVPLPPIPGLTTATPVVHKVTPVAPPIVPSSSQVSYSQIDTPSKIVVEDKVVKKSKDKKSKKQVAQVDEDAMDIDVAEPEAVPESSPEKKTKKEKKDKTEKAEKAEKTEKADKSEKKKDKKEKKEKKERKDKAAKGEDDATATPIARLSASASQPKKVTPVPLPRMF
ncbi:hypothetical protein SBRCBS47491_004806 [Sporothrix bragantina]|uniref:DNA-directed RNA polymerase I subunit n=1 Tax=Sporothrix bragantina TaxID=671064 RepID=A0ABP0BRP5_9PEZI